MDTTLTRLELIPARWLAYEPPSTCHDFGISALLASTLPELFAGAAGPTIGAEILGSALPGAAFGAGTSALTGGKPLMGALTGGLTGGAIGGAGSLAGDLGVSPTIAKTLAGGGAGLLGSEITGTNPLVGGLGGAGAGLLSGGFGSTGAGSTGGGPITTTPASGPAVPSAAPTSAAPLSSDLTAGASIGGGFGDFGGGGFTGGDNFSLGTALTSGAGASGPADITGGLGNASGNAAAGGGFGTTLDAGFSGGGPGGSAITGGPDDFGGGGIKGNWLSDSLGTTGQNDIGSRIANYIGDNPTVPIGAGLLGTSLLMNQGEIPGSGPLKQTSAGLTRLGNEEISSLHSGQVPAGAQTLLNRQKTAMDAHTRSTYASMGLSGSTMEAQALNQNAQTVEASKWNIINDLVKQGTTALTDASAIDSRLMLQEIAKDQATQNAIARFAAALGGGAATTKQAA